jgi:hypothetical protein
MSTLETAIRLLGKSERDEDVRRFLDDVKVVQPLKRPGRGDDQINVVLDDEPFELCFVDADSLPSRSETLMEGELVLSTVFVHRQTENARIDSGVPLPLGLSMDLSRAEMRKKFGQPVWSSPILNNDRWIFDKIRVLACFTDDERSVKQFAFSLAE